MLKWRFFWVGLLSALVVSAQQPLLPLYWQTSENPAVLPLLEKKISKVVADAAKADNDFEHLFRLFKATQAKILRSYSAYTSIDGLARGNYDCLTATALFATLLSQQQFDFDIIETNYHIFLMVRTSQGEVLLETTDRFHGFISNPLEIEQRIDGYRKNLVAQAGPRKRAHDYSFNLYTKVLPEQVAGLLYFNQAVNAFNKGSLALCAEKLLLAHQHYETPRTTELAALVLESLHHRDELSSTEKEQIRKMFMASANQLGVPVAYR